MAGGKSNSLSASFLKLYFQAVAIANIADNAGSSPLGNLYMSLHTISPGAGGTQTTNEAAYPGYSGANRPAVARTTGGFAITGQTINPVAAINFPISSGSPSETEQYFAVGTLITGSGIIGYFGTVTPNIAVTSSGITPSLTTATSWTEA